MKPLLPNKSSKIAFYVILGFLLIGVAMLYFSEDTHGGTLVIIGSLVVMVFLFVMNQFDTP